MAELFPFTEDILASGNMGVIVRMAELSLRFKCMQKEFTAALRTSVHLPETKEGKHAFLNLLLTLSTFEIFFEKEEEDERKDENEDKDDSKEEGGSEVCMLYLYASMQCMNLKNNRRFRKRWPPVFA